MNQSLIAKFRANSEPLPLAPADFDDPHFWDQVDEMLARQRAEKAESIRASQAREG